MFTQIPRGTPSLRTIPYIEEVFLELCLATQTTTDHQDTGGGWCDGKGANETKRCVASPLALRRQLGAGGARAGRGVDWRKDQRRMRRHESSTRRPCGLTPSQTPSTYPKAKLEPVLRRGWSQVASTNRIGDQPGRHGEPARNSLGESTPGCGRGGPASGTKERLDPLEGMDEFAEGPGLWALKQVDLYKASENPQCGAGPQGVESVTTGQTSWWRAGRQEAPRPPEEPAPKPTDSRALRSTTRSARLGRHASICLRCGRSAKGSGKPSWSGGASRVC